MMKPKSSSNGRRYFNSRLFAASRNGFSAAMSEMNAGKNNSQYGKIWFTNLIVNVSKKFNPKFTDINELIEQGWIQGFSERKRIPIETKRLNKRIKNQLKTKLLAESIYKNFIESFDSLTQYAKNNNTSQPRLTQLFKKYIPEYLENRRHGVKYQTSISTVTCQ